MGLLETVPRNISRIPGRWEKGHFASSLVLMWTSLGNTTNHSEMDDSLESTSGFLRVFLSLPFGSLGLFPPNVND